jgi:hypothetical protein
LEVEEFLGRISREEGGEGERDRGREMDVGERKKKEEI